MKAKNVEVGKKYIFKKNKFGIKAGAPVEVRRISEENGNTFVTVYDESSKEERDVFVKRIRKMKTGE